MRKFDRAVAAALLVAVLALVSCAPESVEPPATTTTTTSVVGPGGLREVFVTGAVGYRWADEAVVPGDTLDSANYPTGSTLSVRQFNTTVVNVPFDSVLPVTLCVRLTDGPTGATVGAEQCRTAQGSQGLRSFPAGTFDTLATPLLAGAHEYTVNVRIADTGSECSLPGRCFMAPLFNARINW
ncbi:MAG TPA: hypothetical protein PLS46_00485 [Microthrixaceae bacterium]|nr:hypothetical protein [Microthrixaceae bacterium]